MVIFAGLVVLFLQRSTQPEPRDHMYQYLPACIGCALANFVGNHSWDEAARNWEYAAWAIIAAVIGYVFLVLKPFSPNP